MSQNPVIIPDHVIGSRPLFSVSIGGLSPTILVPVQKPVESEQMLGFSGGHPFVAGKPKTGPDPAKPLTPQSP